ncbi:MAG: hypothetical protein QOK16_4413 [Solirubrobacteraceae bacterium]|jgi:hypothetical protein|nr:hypothetical protein [Solirubrobacteraceae bacterium]
MKPPAPCAAAFPATGYGRARRRPSGRGPAPAARAHAELRAEPPASSSDSAGCGSWPRTADRYGRRRIARRREPTGSLRALRPRAATPPSRPAPSGGGRGAGGFSRTVQACGHDAVRPAADPVDDRFEARELHFAGHRGVLLRARRTAQPRGGGRQCEHDVAVGVRPCRPRPSHVDPACGVVDVGREALDRAAAGPGLQTELACHTAGILADPPEREQLVDPRFGELLGAASTGNGDMSATAASHAAARRARAR